ncbi:Similar to Ubiquitin-like protein; acc. no. Q05120 [Pyronema omphalodes CBS 100304]|uniref:Similar to Ubiquitin-like protein acc. no. Q05120 n=1 Tax=Pyronema omphalodes (strain CBS 100304) TaxID=1076935 RepID=U4L0E2_PYROM|nr:Similar to Ubiquitin-like protein; acc. no. Q05120 [Pyronema omphalodes CBS 100304]
MSEPVYEKLTIISIDGLETELRDVPKNITLAQFKALISREMGAYAADPEYMMLQYLGSQIMGQKDQTLSNFSLRNNAIIRLVDQNPRAGSQPTITAIPPPYSPPLSDHTYSPDIEPLDDGETLRSVFAIEAARTRTHTLQNIPLSMTVGQFKKLVGEKIGNGFDEINCVYGGKSLTDKDNLTLRDLGMQNNATVHLTFRMRGGA